MKAIVTVVVDGKQVAVVLDDSGKAHFPAVHGGLPVAMETSLATETVAIIERKATDALKEMALSNALVMQKNQILNLLQERKIRSAVQLLGLVWRVWDATDYAYKTTEMLALLESVVEHELEFKDLRIECDRMIYDICMDRKVYQSRGF